MPLPLVHVLLPYPTLNAATPSILINLIRKLPKN